MASDVQANGARTFRASHSKELTRISADWITGHVQRSEYPQTAKLSECGNLALLQRRTRAESRASLTVSHESIKSPESI